MAVVAAKYFHNHHLRALCVLSQLGCIDHLSVARFNRRLHALHDWLSEPVAVLGELYAYGDVFMIDSMPLPVCKRAQHVVVAKSAVRPSVAIVPPSARSFSAGDCI